MKNESETTKIKIKYSTLYKMSGFVILLIVIVMLFNGFSKTNLTGNVVSAGYTGDVQVVKMYVENGNYVLEPNSFKVGVPVRIEADISKIPGCSKSVVIPAFNVKKNLNANNNFIEFTPDKAGTFNIACSMNMYKGTFTVLEADGSKTDYAEKANTAVHSCGASAGGGCGCGG